MSVLFVLILSALKMLLFSWKGNVYPVNEVQALQICTKPSVRI